MSCRHKTALLRIPASSLGFKYLREWKKFVNKHDDDFQWEPGYFCESLSDNYPWVPGWRSIDFTDPDRDLALRNPEHPDIVPGPFLDYYLEDDYPFDPEDDGSGANYEVSSLDEEEMERYLPEYQRLFPHFTLRDMTAVRRCRFVWYDGGDAPYLYSDLDDE